MKKEAKGGEEGKKVSSWAMEKRDTKTGMRSNEVNVRKLRQAERRMSWNFGESIPGVLDTRVAPTTRQFHLREIEDQGRQELRSKDRRIKRGN